MAKNKSILSGVDKINSTINSLLNNVQPMRASSLKRDRERDIIDGEVDNIINSEVGNITNNTGDDISTFMVKLYNKTQDNGRNVSDIDDIFNDKNNGVFEVFADRYKSKQLLIEDISVVSGKLFELGEAINTTRDSIVTSDDLSQIVSRTIKFNSANTSSVLGNKDSNIKIVEAIEKRFKLPTKIKNHIVPKALEYGAYYVYTVPYGVMLNKFANRENSEHRLGPVSESFVGEIHSISKNKRVTSEDMSTDGISVINEHIGIPVAEGIDVAQFMKSSLSGDITKSKVVAKSINNKKGFGKFADGVLDKDEFKGLNEIKDCYVELLDPRKVIPIKILKKVVGYYYIHEISSAPVRNVFSSTVSLKDNVNKLDVENKFISNIASRIIKSLDKKFVEENQEFKDLIVNALNYNDLYRKNVKFQFIPAEYITEFAVNRDINDEGTSIVYPALFHAMLYLSLLIFKHITIVSKSNDTRVNYIKDSGVDKNISSKINKIARVMKSREISLDDILNHSSMISKVGNGKELYIPVGASGERGLEFDILSGQQVDLHTELMNDLKSSYINATGVPSVMMSYINEADYSRTLVMANSKYVGRVISNQMDFNPSITELYQKILRYSTDMEEDDIKSFEYILSPPKSLNNNNLADLVSNSENTISFIVKAMTNDLSADDEHDNVIKDILHQQITREILPMIQWERMDELLENAKLEAAARKLNKPKDTSEY